MTESQLRLPRGRSGIMVSEDWEFCGVGLASGTLALSWEPVWLSLAICLCSSVSPGSVSHSLSCTGRRGHPAASSFCASKWPSSPPIAFLWLMWWVFLGSYTLCANPGWRDGVSDGQGCELTSEPQNGSALSSLTNRA